MPLLDIRLIFVNEQQLLFSYTARRKIGHQRKPPVGSRLGFQGLFDAGILKPQYPGSYRTYRIIFAGSSTTQVARFHLGFDAYLERDKGLALAIADDRMGLIKNSRTALELSSADTTRQVKQLGFGSTERYLALLSVVHGFLRAPAPDQTETILCFFGAGAGGGIDIGRIALSAFVLQHQKATPAGVQTFAQLAAKALIFSSTAGKHRDELAAVIVDMLEVLSCGQFAVGNIYEITSEEELPQQIDIGAVDSVVGAVAAVDFM